MWKKSVCHRLLILSASLLIGYMPAFVVDLKVQLNVLLFIAWLVVVSVVFAWLTTEPTEY